MNYTEEVHDLVIKIFSDLSADELYELSGKIEDFIIAQDGMEGAAVTSLIVKEDAVR